MLGSRVVRGVAVLHVQVWPTQWQFVVCPLAELAKLASIAKAEALISIGAPLNRATTEQRSPYASCRLPPYREVECHIVSNMAIDRFRHG